jgi:hypothetical protein
LPNIAVGILLTFLAVPVIFKQVISWTFIVGTLLHSGVLFLAAALQLPFAASPLAPVGPFLILLGLLLAGIATVMGYQTVLVKDDGGKKKKVPRTKASRIWRSLTCPDQEAAAYTTPPFHSGATTTRKHACAARSAASASAGDGARANIKPR